MKDMAFTYVPAEGFIGLSNDLHEGAWGLVDVTAFEGPDRTAAKPLCDAPFAVHLKLQLAWVIGALMAAKDGAGSAGDLDRSWDATQKRLRSRLDTAAADKDSKKREAADRLKKSLTIGSGGEGQTKLKYHQEVDFGRQQLRITSSGQAAADVTLLGLGDVLADIANDTDALAGAIGYGQSSNRPHERLRGAIAACVSRFSAVADQLSWTAENGQTGADRERAAALRVPMEALSARYPAPAAVAPAAPAPPATPPATTDGPATGDPPKTEPV